MPEEIDVACPGCNAIFGVPMEFCGETAECAECGTMFEIPTIEPTNDSTLANTDTGAIKGVEADDVGEATNTVRLSRTGIGMIPQVKDNFQLGGTPPTSSAVNPPKAPAGRTFTKPGAPQPPAPAPAAAPPSAPAPAPAPSPTAAPAPAPAAAPSPAQASASPRQKIVLPDWTKVRMKKGEEVIGLRETSSSAAGAAILAAVMAIVAGGAAIALKDNIALSAGAAFGAAVVAFVVILVMGNVSSKRALVVTNQRSITVIGKDRMEVKQ